MSGETGIFEDLKATVEMQTEEIRALRAEVASLHEKVEPMKGIYTVKDLWLISGGAQLCTFSSFLKNAHLPEPEGYSHRMRAWKRETVRKWLREFDVHTPTRRGRKEKVSA